jgi:hypothetical protein
MLNTYRDTLKRKTSYPFGLFKQKEIVDAIGEIIYEKDQRGFKVAL